ncbi:hypothetical protein D9757_006203 [Collybiopsis confluens]|uniref:Translin-associated protein X n=1 Tax=Collybiopsis confluens TaxID=2823264 RepID=A0A8H5HJI3_9AGAR|nr:hypothetical protein D9757_006203 [Collybiopsis confluens]
MPLSVHDTFQQFRNELDEHHDRRERLIKASRDITNISKKTIFLVHRLVMAHDSSARKNAAKDGFKNLTQVHAIYAEMKKELVGDQFWRYQRQMSPGVQEYIEAFSFCVFLQDGSLVSYDQIQASLCGADGELFFPLAISDYLLGISDLTGELLRFAIAGFSHPGGRAKALETCHFVRNYFERFTPHVWELHKKQAITAESLTKIEDAAYAAVVRTSEFNLPPEMLDDIVRRVVSSYNLKGREDFDQPPLF